MSHQWRLLAYGVIALVALCYAWPLASRLTTAIPGSSVDLDVATFVWNQWWTHTAIDNGQHILRTDWVLVPFGADLRLHTYGWLQNLLAYPVSHLLGEVGAFNLVVILTLFLNGAFAYRLVWRTLNEPARGGYAIRRRPLDDISSGSQEGGRQESGSQESGRQEGGSRGDARGGYAIRRRPLDDISSGSQEGGSQESTRQESTRQEGGRQESGRQESARQENARGGYHIHRRPLDSISSGSQESTRQESTRQESTRQESTRQEGGRRGGARGGYAIRRRPLDDISSGSQEGGSQESALLASARQENARGGYAIRRMLAALVASVCLMLASPVLAHIGVGRPSFASLWIVIGGLLTLGDLLCRPRWTTAILLGGWWVAALLSDLQIVLYTALWQTLYGVGWWWREGRGKLTWPRLGGLALAGAIFSLPFGLVYYPAFVSAAALGYPRPSLADMVPFSFRVWDYVTPSALGYAYGPELLFAAVVAPLLLRRRVGPRHGLPYLFWMFGALVFLVLALGPYLQPTQIPLPFALLSRWPPLAQFRTPARLAQPALIGLVVVLGHVLAYAFARLRPVRLVIPIVTLAIVGRLVFALWHDPVAVQTYPSYAIYHRLADDPEDFTVLEVPFGVRSGLERIGEGGEALQYYQIIHGKRLLNGMIARLPKSVFDFYRDQPALLFLSGEDIDRDTVQRSWESLLAWSHTKYILVHRSWLSTDQANRIETFLDAQPMLQGLGLENDVVIYLRR